MGAGSSIRKSRPNTPREEDGAHDSVDQNRTQSSSIQTQTSLRETRPGSDNGKQASEPGSLQAPQVKCNVTSIVGG